MITVVTIANTMRDRENRLEESMLPFVKEIILGSESLRNKCSILDNFIITTKEVALKILETAQRQAHYKSLFYHPNFFAMAGAIALQFSQTQTPEPRTDLDNIANQALDWMKNALLILSLVLLAAGWLDSRRVQVFGLHSMHVIWKAASEKLSQATAVIRNIPENQNNQPAVVQESPTVVLFFENEQPVFRA